MKKPSKRTLGHLGLDQSEEHHGKQGGDGHGQHGHEGDHCVNL